MSLKDQAKAQLANAVIQGGIGAIKAFYSRMTGSAPAVVEPEEVHVESTNKGLFDVHQVSEGGVNYLCITPSGIIPDEDDDLLSREDVVYLVSRLNEQLASNFLD